MVQLINGYRNRRSDGLKSSFTQSGQGAISGAISVFPGNSLLLSTISNVSKFWIRSSGPVRRSGESAISSTASTTARGGGFSRTSRTKEDKLSVSPSSTISTPSKVFLAQPVTCKLRASRCRNGRIPTPWTIPETFTRTHCRPAPGPDILPFITECSITESWPGFPLRSAPQAHPFLLRSLR